MRRSPRGTDNYVMSLFEVIRWTKAGAAGMPDLLAMDIFTTGLLPDEASPPLKYADDPATWPPVPDNWDRRSQPTRSPPSLLTTAKSHLLDTQHAPTLAQPRRRPRLTNSEHELGSEKGPKTGTLARPSFYFQLSGKSP
jgi:hypothetical protein